MSRRATGALSMGTLDPALEKESEPLVQAARELDQLGLSALEKASLFGNVTALFAMKSRLNRRAYLELCAALWDETRVQMSLLDVPASITRGGVA